LKASAQTIFTGLLFSILWASASVAGKFGLFSVEPLLFFTIRFLAAGIILLAFVYGVQRTRLPQGVEWKQITLFGAFNTTLYLGIFIVALQFMTPGITSLAIALNPLFISLMTALWMKRKVRAIEWLSLVLGLLGVFVAAYPLLQSTAAKPEGIALLVVSMVTYSFGAVYYAATPWTLSRTSINAWQVFIGGILLIPFAYFMHERTSEFDFRFYASLAWLIFPVSILAVQLWLRLLKADAVRASMWLYLCPIFGFMFAALLLDEPLTMYTLVGTILVMTALYLGQKGR
jgi:probable blue pigment (indigoidine) exporter